MADLRHVYEQTKAKYRLELAAGISGLDGIFNWVYISEDLKTADFLQGGELVITTGVSSVGDPEWLYRFIETMIAHQTSGLIINMGKYVLREDITSKIRALCDREHFPLFLMPWEVHIYDITRDYYNRIFQETTESHEISQAFLSVLYRDGDYAKSIHTLENNGYEIAGKYCVAVAEFVRSKEQEALAANGMARLRYEIGKYRNENRLAFTMLETKRNLLFVWKMGDPEQIGEAMEELLGKIRQVGARLYGQEAAKDFCTVGIGGKAVSLAQLKASHAQAQAAAAMAKYQGEELYSYEKMGFFKLLLAIEDKKILKDYEKEQLGDVLAYDKAHGSDYTETLYQFLLHQGSIQAAAAAMFCHRNTVNYRMKVLREFLNRDLEDTQTRFELITAFQIREYLRIMGEN